MSGGLRPPILKFSFKVSDVWFCEFYPALSLNGGLWPGGRVMSGHQYFSGDNHARTTSYQRSMTGPTSSTQLSANGLLTLSRHDTTVAIIGYGSPVPASGEQQWHFNWRLVSRGDDDDDALIWWIHGPIVAANNCNVAIAIATLQRVLSTCNMQTWATTRDRTYRSWPVTSRLWDGRVRIR